MPITPANFTATNTSNWGTWLGAVNALTGGWIGTIILMIVFLGTLVTLRLVPMTRTSECFAVAGFVTWIVATLLLAGTIVSITIWAVSFSLMILGAMWVWMDG